MEEQEEIETGGLYSGSQSGNLVAGRSRVSKESGGGRLWRRKQSLLDPRLPKASFVHHTGVRGRSGGRIHGWGSISTCIGSPWATNTDLTLMTVVPSLNNPGLQSKGI